MSGASRSKGKARHKFGAKPTTVRGRRYASRLEGQYAEKLHVLKAAGHLLGWLEQVPFHLPGGVTYRCDFQEFWADGRVVFTEVKGHETEQWKIKQRQVEALYPWAEINVVRKVR